MTDQSIRPCRLSDLVTDPAVHGDLLALGAALVHLLDHTDEIARGNVNGRELGELAWPQHVTRQFGALETLRRVVRDDARRYVAPMRAWGATCEAPRVRTEGPCGRPASTPRWHITDWTTGEKTEIRACSRRDHREWQEATVRRNWAARPENPPVPCANAGGVLRGHFPELDWAELYRWATDGRWVEPPEREPVRKPTLSVIVGDATETSGDRALLTALPGGTWSGIPVVAT